MRYSDTNVLNGYKALYGATAESDTRFPIPLPYGATSVAGTVSDNTLYLEMHLFDSGTPSENRPNSSATYSAKRVGRIAGTGSISNSFTSFTDADSFVIASCHTNNDGTEADLSATITLIFT